MLKQRNQKAGIEKSKQMKTHIKNLLLLPALIVGLGLIPTGRVMAQTFSVLHTFTAPAYYGHELTNSDGFFPVGGLVASGSTLYGTAARGGENAAGTIYKVNTDGTGFTILYTLGNNGADGLYPSADLILSGNTLYGTAQSGGIGAGTVFAVNTDGTGFRILHNFTGYAHDGASPQGALILSGNTLYGTTVSGGSDYTSDGTVFAINTNGTDYRILYSFTGIPPIFGNVTNSDGASPIGGLVLSDNTLYGTAYGGGNSGVGTVFTLSTDGTGFTILHSFTGGGDGGQPFAGLVLSGNTLYGAAQSGGISGWGTVFAVNTDGTSFTTLHSFADGVGAPLARLILSGNTLYGTAMNGGDGHGSVFAINTDGTNFTNLHNFAGSGEEGGSPYAGVILSGTTLYGAGGSAVFSLSFAPQLNITPSAANVILTWPTNVVGFDYSGFTLQSTTNLAPAVWSSVSPAPIVVNGQITVTNPISGSQKFFRLIQ